MVDGKHAIPGDRSFAVSLLRHLAGAVALVAFVSAAFWGIGRVRPTIGEIGVARDGIRLEGPSAAIAPPPESEGAPQPGLAPSILAGSPSPALSQTPSPSPSASPTASIAPSRISVQVLDATGDGGVRARTAVARLRADGYKVVATNEASRIYSRTEVFYSPGHEAEARQIAAAYGFSSVRPKPSNLTSSVDVHLVIGRDYQTR